MERFFKITWRLYFFVMLLSFAVLLAYPFLFPGITQDAVDYAYLFTGFIALVGLFGYAFGIPIVTAGLWKACFVFVVLY